MGLFLKIYSYYSFWVHKVNGKVETMIIKEILEKKRAYYGHCS